MDVDFWLRALLISLGIAEIILTCLWLIPKLRARVLPTGEAIARMGGGVLVGGVTYGTSTLLFQFPGLLLVIVGLSWLVIGMSISLYQERKDRRAGRASHQGYR